MRTDTALEKPGPGGEEGGGRWRREGRQVSLSNSYHFDHQRNWKMGKPRDISPRGCQRLLSLVVHPLPLPHAHHRASPPAMGCLSPRRLFTWLGPHVQAW